MNPSQVQQPVKTPWRNNKIVKLFISAVVTALVAAVLVWWLFFRSFISTNDARIETNLLRIAPVGVGGQIKKIYVDEGDRVKSGQLLAEIDHSVPEEQFNMAKAKFDLAKAELARIKSMEESDFSSKKELDSASANYDIAQADFELAKINLENTYLKSPIDGVVVQKLAEEGNIIEPGQVALTLSDIDNAWVSANIEETSVAKIKVGQPVDIFIDEGGSLKGKVEEITAATAAQFSLLPAENASGNFTKVVQKIPIKISLDPHPDRKILRAGQSVTVKIRIR